MVAVRIAFNLLIAVVRSTAVTTTAGAAVTVAWKIVSQWLNCSKSPASAPASEPAAAISIAAI